MLRVPLAQAKPGMKLAVEIRHPKTGQRLLGEGFELDEHLIEKLDELEIHEVWIDYPNTDQIRKYVSPEVARAHGRMVSMITGLFTMVHREAHANVEFPQYRRTLRELIETLVGNPLSSTYILEAGGGASNELRHAAEVCFLSMLLGLKLQGYLIMQRRRLSPTQARNVVSLGIGAMVHDIGMGEVGEETRERYERFRDERDEEWRRHVTLGHRKASGLIPPAASGVVLHHHQHYDGSGFPEMIDADGRQRGLIGDEIHVFARIACVANHFDRLRRPAEGRVEPRVRVLRHMLMSELTRRFDPVVLAAVPLVVPAYPPGSMVTLNTGQRAMVYDWHPECPCQPTVQLIDDRRRRGVAEPVRYDLRDRNDLLIVEAEGSDISQDNFRLKTTLQELHPEAV